MKEMRSSIAEREIDKDRKSEGSEKIKTDWREDLVENYHKDHRKDEMR